MLLLDINKSFDHKLPVRNQLAAISQRVQLLSSNSKAKPSTRRSEKPRKGSDILGTMDC